jgi:acyl-coenzyme A synthetase/AMP-(fatty) acid ligase
MVDPPQRRKPINPMTTAPLTTLLLDIATADRPIARTDGHVITLRRFRADVSATVARLTAAGCRSGLVACNDAYWAAVGMFALAHIGSETILTPNVLPATLSAIAGTFDLIITDGALSNGDRTLTLAPSNGDVASLPPMDADNACVTLFTSGSTGLPKRVTKTIRQLELEARAVEGVLGRTVPRNSWIHATVTHQHQYGLTFRLCWPLATRRAFFGNTQHFWEPLLAGLDTGSVVVTSPSHLARLGGLAPLPAGRRPSAVLSAGAPLSVNALRDTHEVLGCATREFFGSTEAGVIATRLREGEADLAWQPMPGVTVTRLDDGRLRVYSPFLGSPSYAVGSDLIEVDCDGGFRLLGRADRIAKIEGLRVSLGDFEARLAELEGVADAAIVVLGTDTLYLGGVVVLDAAGRTELATCGEFYLGRRLRRELSRKLPSAALPRCWRFVPTLQTGPLGKTSAAYLAALFDVPQAMAS